MDNFNEMDPVQAEYQKNLLRNYHNFMEKYCSNSFLFYNSVFLLH